ncbi:MAG TPA: hypothetical protein VIG24_00690 [Acidimicrobiia bacterium]
MTAIELQEVEATFHCLDHDTEYQRARRRGVEAAVTYLRWLRRRGRVGGVDQINEADRLLNEHAQDDRREALPSSTVERVVAAMADPAFAAEIAATNNAVGFGRLKEVGLEMSWRERPLVGAKPETPDDFAAGLAADDRHPASRALLGRCDAQQVDAENPGASLWVMTSRVLNGFYSSEVVVVAPDKAQAVQAAAAAVDRWIDRQLSDGWVYLPGCGIDSDEPGFAEERQDFLRRFRDEAERELTIVADGGEVFYST